MRCALSSTVPEGSADAPLGERAHLHDIMQRLCSITGILAPDLEPPSAPEPPLTRFLDTWSHAQLQPAAASSWPGTRSYRLLGLSTCPRLAHLSWMGSKAGCAVRVMPHAPT